MLRIPHCLDNRLTDGGKVVSLRHRPRYTNQKRTFILLLALISVRGYKPRGLVRPEGLGKLKVFYDLMGSRTHDLPVCNIMP
jgi:hypothetical protein